MRWSFVKSSDLAGAIAALEKDVAGSSCMAPPSAMLP